MTDRLNDPADHFPYKAAEAKALLDENPPLGPDGPDDDRVRAEDYLSADIVEASAAYVEAQAAYLSDPGDGTKAAYQGARDKLQAARAAHRANRPAGPVVIGIRARRAGE
jgi:hypothetical protein